MKSKFNRFAEINAIKKNDDGTIVVSGFASSGATDSDDEVITPEAMAAAIPDYMKFGAVREMHGKSAAGTALEIAVEDDGRTSFSAHIVDPIAVKKVETGVYKGFSIGGTIKSRDTVNKSTITGLNLIEVSLVDRPANPEALITMFKAEEPKSEKLTKGMSHVAELAWMLKHIGWLTDDQISEMQREGDGSGVPARLLACPPGDHGQVFRTVALKASVSVDQQSDCIFIHRCPQICTDKIIQTSVNIREKDQ